MKIIKEHINFQRGIDPKDAMKTGIKQQFLKFIIKELFPIVIKEANKYQSGTFIIYDIPRKKPIEQKNKIKLLIKKFGFNNFEVIFSENYNQYTIYINDLNESLNFERNIDPKAAMGIGSRKQIITWLKENGKFDEDEIEILKNGTINVHLDYTYGLRGKNGAGLSNLGIFELPTFIQFNIWRGRCFMNWNNMTNMRGCPKIVTENFYINGNPLESLDYLPKEIGGILFIAKICGFTEAEIRKISKIGNEIKFTNTNGEQTWDEIKQIK